MITSIVPLIIDGADFVPSDDLSALVFEPNPDNINNHGTSAVGANPELCIQAVESSARAFITWKESPLSERRKLFLTLAQLIQDRHEELNNLIQREILCTATWARINILDSIAIAEQCAAGITAGFLSGTVPAIGDAEAHAMVVKEPLGVVLAIAPWNAPLILGLRAVAAAVAAGNTVILKGSEISPRTHFFIAKLFQEAGFPAGVVNFIQHRPQDASDCFEAMISHNAVQKCNFTGSTPVGRHIAQRAAFYLKPVTLELGGKNFVIVTEDANLEKAVDQVLLGAFLNSGQICMSTDLVLVARAVDEEFRSILRRKLPRASKNVVKTINATSQSKIQALVKDATEKGACSISDDSNSLVVLEDVSKIMNFWTAESFGPLLGLAVYDLEEDAIRSVNESSYGLSAAIHCRNHLRALKIAKQLQVGAVHVNSATVHDEPTLPHGGRKESGWGRFGAHWGFEEFLQTKTIILHP